jgi:hypothetical protein
MPILLTGFDLKHLHIEGRRVRDRMVIKTKDLQLSVQWVLITTNFASSSTAHGELYTIKLIKLISGLQKVGVFLPVLLFPPSLKLTATI